MVLDNRGGFRGRGNARPAVKKEEPTEAEIQKQVRETLENCKGNLKKVKELNIVEIKEIHTVNITERSRRQHAERVKY